VTQVVECLHCPCTVKNKQKIKEWDGATTNTKKYRRDFEIG
jgi:hypothetical protein